MPPGFLSEAGRVKKLLRACGIPRREQASGQWEHSFAIEKCLILSPSKAGRVGRLLLAPGCLGDPEASFQGQGLGAQSREEFSAFSELLADHVGKKWPCLRRAGWSTGCRDPAILESLQLLAHLSGAH